MKKLGLTLLATTVASAIMAATAFAQTATPTPTSTSGSVNGTSTTVPSGAPTTGHGS